jgi:hypothetical protein
LLASACGEPPPGGGRDASTEVRADAGGADAGAAEADTGPSGPLDAGQADAADQAPDAADQPADAGAGADSGAAPDAATCAPLEPGDSVLANADFEDWSAGSPVSWLGPESNIGTVEMAQPGAVCSARAVRLVNTGGSHQRFASASMALPAGHYSCTFQVRGQGEVRAGDYTQGDYGYGSYVTAGDDWAQATYEFSAPDGDPGEFAFLFSVRNTAAPDHVLVDRIACLRDPAPCDTVVLPEWAAAIPRRALQAAGRPLRRGRRQLEWGPATPPTPACSRRIAATSTATAVYRADARVQRDAHCLRAIPARESLRRVEGVPPADRLRPERGR